jgi:uncharacterized ferritin-like protein (DUF455 family)
VTTAAALLTCGDLATLIEGAGCVSALGPVVAVEDIAFPPQTRVVPARQVPKRSPHTVQGRIALLHALAHIELSAVLLALDHACRFAALLPPAYAEDWLRVAGEEAHHFSLLQNRLSELGSTYGDLPVHDSQWRTAVRTSHDPLARMALVPRVAEARGVDVTPGIIAALRGAGDAASVAVLEVILRDEVGHVLVGDRWFRHLCGTRDAELVFRGLLADYGVLVRPPFNYDARVAGGFSVSELDALTKEALGSSI